jgi:hypothetical protein
MKYGEACTKEGSSHENFNGMSEEKNSSVETIVTNEDSVSDEALSLQVVNEEIITIEYAGGN